MIRFSKKELIELIISILIIGFVVGFNDKRETFQLSLWLSNLLLSFFFVAVVFLVHTLGHKLMALPYSCSTEYRIWGLKQYGLASIAKFPRKLDFIGTTLNIPYLPIGAIIALIVAFISNGKALFLAIESFDMSTEGHRRMGRKQLDSETTITGFEVAKISLAGPLANIVFAFLLILLKIPGVEKLVFLNWLFAVYHMIPFSTLDGSRIFFNSRTLYGFGLAYIVFLVLLINLISATLALFITSLIAVITTLIIFYVLNFKS